MSSTDRSASPLRDHVVNAYKAGNRLMSAQFEVTHRCPCSCVHCYLKQPETAELSIEEIASVFRQLAIEGVLELGITGGEPFLRPDLDHILELARRERFLVTVQASGVLIGPSEIDLLKTTGVASVEMSLLGGTAATHDRLMGYDGAFDAILETVGRVRAAGIRAALKATLMRENFHERELMAQIAERLEVPLSTAALIAPAMDGSLRPQKHMITAAQAATYSEPRANRSADRGLICQAGRVFCCITPGGDVTPCTLLRRRVGNLRRNSLQQIWHENPEPFLSELREMQDEDVSVCYKCEERRSCERCPGIAFLETGTLEAPSAAACRLAGHRRD